VAQAEQQGIKSKTLPAGARKPSADTPHRSNMDVGLVDALCDYSRPVFLFGERPEYPYRIPPWVPTRGRVQYDRVYPMLIRGPSQCDLTSFASADSFTPRPPSVASSQA
jgi:hypothetical protein